MSSRRRIASALIVTLIATACGMPATAPPDVIAAQESTAGVETTTTTVVETKETDNAVAGHTGFDCPVTVPPQQPGYDATKPENVTYTEHFPAPDPWPSQYPHEGMVWYGTEGLWTALAIDGHHSPRKSVWWSVNFPGGAVEGQPDVTVTWTRLDTDQPIVIDNDGKATNAFTPEEGWFMIAGGDPNEPGCWEVEATYKGTTLRYVYEKTG